MPDLSTNAAMDSSSGSSHSNNDRSNDQSAIPSRLNPAVLRAESTISSLTCPPLQHRDSQGEDEDAKDGEFPSVKGQQVVIQHQSVNRKDSGLKDGLPYSASESDATVSSLSNEVNKNSSTSSDKKAGDELVIEEAKLSTVALPPASRKVTGESEAGGAGSGKTGGGKAVSRTDATASEKRKAKSGTQKQEFVKDKSEYDEGEESDYDSYSSLSGENQSVESQVKADNPATKQVRGRKKSRKARNADFLCANTTFVRFNEKRNDAGGSDGMSSLSNDQGQDKSDDQTNSNDWKTSKKRKHKTDGGMNQTEEVNTAKPVPFNGTKPATVSGSSEGNSSSSSGGPQDVFKAPPARRSHPNESKISTVQDSAQYYSDLRQQNAKKARVSESDGTTDSGFSTANKEFERQLNSQTQTITPDDDASLITPQGQLAKNPRMTDDEAILAAKREYNRRNAARARVRSKKLIEKLQYQVLKLTDETKDLENSNGSLRQRVDDLKKENNDLVLNQRAVTASFESATFDSQFMSSQGQRTGNVTTSTYRSNGSNCGATTNSAASTTHTNAGGLQPVLEALLNKVGGNNKTVAGSASATGGQYAREHQGQQQQQQQQQQPAMVHQQAPPVAQHAAPPPSGNSNMLLQVVSQMISNTSGQSSNQVQSLLNTLTNPAVSGLLLPLLQSISNQSQGREMSAPRLPVRSEAPCFHNRVPSYDGNNSQPTGGSRPNNMQNAVQTATLSVQDFQLLTSLIAGSRNGQASFPNADNQNRGGGSSNGF